MKPPTNHFEIDQRSFKKKTWIESERRYKNINSKFKNQKKKKPKKKKKNKSKSGKWFPAMNDNI